MAKYFIDRKIYWNGNLQPPRKVILYSAQSNGETVTGYNEDGDSYTLNINDVFDDNDNPIKDAREKVSLSQAKLSELLGIPKRTIENWEMGKTKPPEYVERMLIEKLFAML